MVKSFLHTSFYFQVRFPTHSSIHSFTIHSLCQTSSLLSGLCSHVISSKRFFSKIFSFSHPELFIFLPTFFFFMLLFILNITCMSLFAPFLSPTLEHKLHEVRDFVSFSAESLHPAQCLAHSICEHSVTSDSLGPHGPYSPPGSSAHGISQQEYWGGFPFLPGDLPDPGVGPFVSCASYRQIYPLSQWGRCAIVVEGMLNE